MGFVYSPENNCRMLCSGYTMVPDLYGCDRVIDLPACAADFWQGFIRLIGYPASILLGPGHYPEVVMLRQGQIHGSVTFVMDSGATKI